MRKHHKPLFQEDLKKTIHDTYSDDPTGMANPFQELFHYVLNLHAVMKKRRAKAEFA